jgi:hypothetical protein
MIKLNNHKFSAIPVVLLLLLLTGGIVARIQAPVYAKNVTSISTELCQGSVCPVSNIAAGNNVHDTATLSGETSNAGGTVTYDFWFSGTDGTCSGGDYVTANEPVTDGVVHNSPSYGPLSAGVYSWQAVYSGDSNNNGAVSACESLTVSNPTYAVTIASGTGGSTQYSYGSTSGTVPAGQSVTVDVTSGTDVSLTANPIPNEYIFYQWTTTGSVSVGNPDAPSTTLAVSGTGSVTANFESTLAVYISPASASINLGQSVVFTAYASGGSGEGYTYMWYWSQEDSTNQGSQSTGSVDQYTFTPANTGTFIVYCVVTDSFGDQNTATASTVTVGSAPAPTNLQVIVYDVATGNPIEGATVEMTSAPAGQALLTGTTGSAGQYTFSNVQPGSYTIQASATGYASYSQSGSVLSGETGEIQIYLFVPIAGSSASATETGSSWSLQNEAVCSGTEDCTITDVSVSASPSVTSSSFDSPVETFGYAPASCDGFFKAPSGETLIGCIDAQIPNAETAYNDVSLGGDFYQFLQGQPQSLFCDGAMALVGDENGQQVVLAHGVAVSNFIATNLAGQACSWDDNFYPDSDVASGVDVSAGLGIAIAVGLLLSTPVAIFMSNDTISSTANPVDDGQTITLSTIESTGGPGPYTYAWMNLPPGCTSSSSASFTCTPSTGSGVYNVTATMTDGDGNTVTSFYYLLVNPALSIGTPSASSNPAEEGQPITLSTPAAVGGVEPYTYSWSNLPVGCTSSNSTSISCTPSSAGSYDVSVTVTDSDGNTATSSFSLTVNPRLSASPSATMNPVEVGLMTTISADASDGVGPYTYAWSGLPDGCNSTAASFACTPTDNFGSPYTVQVIVTDSNDIMVTETFSLTVDPALSVSVPPVTIDSGQTATLTASASGGSESYTVYDWYLGDVCTGTAVQSGPSPSYTTGPLTTATVYCVEVIDSLGGTAQTTVTVNIYGPFSVTVSGVTTIDSGQYTTLTANPIGGSGEYTYQWYSDASCSGSTVGTSVSYTTPTLTGPATDTYCVKVTDSVGGTAEYAVTVTVNPAPSVSVPPVTIDIGQTATLTASASGGSGSYTYAWYQGDVCSGSVLGTSVSYTTGALTTTTEYCIKVTDSLGSTTTAAAAVTVNPVLSVSVPGVTIYSGQTATLTASASGGSGSYPIYAWYLGGCTGTPLQTGTSSSYTTAVLTITTTYCVKVTDSLGSTATTTVPVTVVAVTVTCTEPTVVGKPTTCTAAVIGSKPFTGTVTWSSSGLGKFSPASATCKLSKNKDSCSVKYIPSSAGTATITASYSPSGGSKNPASLGTFILTVSKATSKVILTCSPKSTKVGKTTKCTATVTGYSPTWTGIPETSVTFSASGTGGVTLSSITCTMPKGNRFSCSVTLTGNTAGPVGITASYIGDANNAPSTSKSFSLTIRPSS